MKENKKVVIFDFDGVIVDTFDFCYQITKINNPKLTSDEYRTYFEGNINDAKKVEKTDFDFFAHYTPRLQKKEPIEEISDVIKKLSEKYTLVIVSSTITPPITEFLKKHNLLEYFSDILGNDIAKSKMVKIQMVLDKHNINAKDCVFVTDTLGDIKEADNMNVRSIAVLWGYHDMDTLKHKGVFCFSETARDIVILVEKYFANL